MGRRHHRAPRLEGKVYCAVVLDTFSRRVVAWSIDASPTAALATDAMALAIGNRSPRPGGTIIHSDHGVQFGSWAFTRRARASGLLPSMDSIADCVDNAMMEPFWARGSRSNCSTADGGGRVWNRPPLSSSTWKPP
ncbi:transposase [Streptomyces sp. QTS52]